MINVMEYSVTDFQEFKASTAERIDDRASIMGKCYGT